MEKLIHRRYGFNVQDVKDALIADLRSSDIPIPDSSSTNVKFELTPTGATLEWEEESET